MTETMPMQLRLPFTYVERAQNRCIRDTRVFRCPRIGCLSYSHAREGMTVEGDFVVQVYRCATCDLEWKRSYLIF